MKISLLPRFLAVFLSLWLALPSPAFALRTQAGLETNTEQELTQALQPAAGLEGADRFQRIPVTEREDIERKLRAVLKDLTGRGFTYQILDQGLVEEFPQLGVLASLSPRGILIDRSETPDQTRDFIIKELLPHEVRRVGYYPGQGSERVGWFVQTAQSALIHVDMPEPAELQLLPATRQLARASRLIPRPAGHPRRVPTPIYAAVPKRSNLSAIQILIREVRGTPTRAASWSIFSSRSLGTSTLTR